MRPMIRASEIPFDAEKSDWSSKFWQECMIKTPCFPMGWVESSGGDREGFVIAKIDEAWKAMQLHFHGTLNTTAPDPKHDTVFGIAFYVLTMAKELLQGEVSTSVGARFILRTIVENYITLAYMLKKNEDTLWQSYRAYGAGQAKLAFLKAEADSNPAYNVDLKVLERLANEDVWIEFLAINIGHWETSNLRDLSIKADVKDVYDRYYSWTSNFSHGHWAAIRNTVYDTCANPLHRLHNIPRKRQTFS